MNSIHRSVLTRALMTGVALLAFVMMGGGGVRAEIVTVQGDDAAAGVSGAYPGDLGYPNGLPGGDGGDATASASSADPINKATAIGGNGGRGVSGGPDGGSGDGGWGGNASATAATTVISGSAEADATAVGGALGSGSFGIPGSANAVANAAAAGGGNAVATASATGGPCNGPCQPSNSGYATSNAETVNGAMADAQSVGIPGIASSRG